ncbi:tyrosine--tRNA ligase [mine drainage metagenome]|uniref:Tyrosine--tRNA ligase n=1 Tax=mine drainage metagenome TaxID=410659 RepID=A0A1J5PEJ0_9ZZZZ
MPLLEGTDGVNKMSKSLGNYIGITEAPNEIFGKIMSVSDELMWRYIELLSSASLSSIGEWKAQVAAGANPRNIKVRFAQEIITRFHNAAAAEQALNDFESRFRQGGIPDEIATVVLDGVSGGVPIAQVLKQAGLTASTSDAMRMIEQGGVKLDGDKVSDKALVLQAGCDVVLQVGKRKYARIVIS